MGPLGQKKGGEKGLIFKNVPGEKRRLPAASRQQETKPTVFIGVNNRGKGGGGGGKSRPASEDENYVVVQGKIEAAFVPRDRKEEGEAQAFPSWIQHLTARKRKGNGRRSGLQEEKRKRKEDSLSVCHSEKGGLRQ